MRKHDLQRQIAEKRRAENVQKHQERIKDVENLWVAGKVMEKEHKEYLEKDRFAKSMYKQIWKEQMKLNKHREVIRQENGEKI